MAEHKNYGLTGVGPNVEIGKGGPRVKNSSGRVDFRNNADSDYANVAGADPTQDQDFVTKKYLETNANVSVTAQIDGGSPGSGAFTGEIAIVTTAGGSFALKELYRWDGSAWVQLTVFEGMRISVTDALSGGTDEYLADHLYLWDEDDSTWVDIGPNSALSNVLRKRSVTVDFNDSDGAINIGAVVPVGAIVTRVKANVTQVFNGTTPTLKVGDAGDDDRLMTDQQVCIDVVGLYVTENLHTYGSATQLIATLAKGSSTQGQVDVCVEYFIP